MRAAVIVAAAASCLTLVAQSQTPSPPGPPIPFEDPGACPFEGCSYTYRQWTTNARVTLRKERRSDSPVLFTLPAREKVTAITGVVITVKPALVRFERAAMIADVRMEAGDVLHMLTYQGEGFTKAWIKGKLYTDVDTAEFYNGVCDHKPERCAGKIVEKAMTEWWVQIRDRQGRVGWTSEPEKFDGKSAIGR